MANRGLETVAVYLLDPRQYNNVAIAVARDQLLVYFVVYSEPGISMDSSISYVSRGGGPRYQVPNTQTISGFNALRCPATEFPKYGSGVQASEVIGNQCPGTCLGR